LLANPRWERRFVKFLELSGVGRRGDAAKMDEWAIWEAEERNPSGG